jgi:ABC-2 type transport system permease protein
MISAQLKAQIVKELLSFLRDPKSRFMLIGPPLMQMFIFSFAVTLEVRNIDVAVFNEDAGRSSYELLSQIAGAGFVDETIAAHSTAELATLIEQRRVLVALHIPADFSRAIAASRPAKAQALVDGRRANSGQIALSYLNSIMGRFGAEASGNASSDVAVRYWFNPNLIFQWFVVPGLGAVLTMMIAMLVTGLSIARERELGTFDQLLVSPTTPTDIVIGKTVPAVVLGVVLAAVMALAAVLAFRIPFTGSVLWLAVALVIFILSVVGIGLVVSSICQTQQQAILGVFAVAVPIVLISGFATPVENMPYPLQLLAEASPLKHYLIIVQGSFLKAMSALDVLSNVWPMCVIAAVTLPAAVVIVRRRLQ